MVKQFIAEPHKITLSDNTSEAVVTQTADSDVVAHNTNQHFIGGLTRVQGVEGGDAIVELFADQGDDNADKWRFRLQDGGVLTLETYQSGAWVIASQWSVASENTKPLQPAFLVTPAAEQTDFATGSDITVVFGTEIIDRGANFATNTFTAPVTGLYQLNVMLFVTTIDSAASYYELKIITSNRTYQIDYDVGKFSGDLSYWPLALSILVDLDVSDTAHVTIKQSGGTQQADISTASVFSGYLAA